MTSQTKADKCLNGWIGLLARFELREVLPVHAGPPGQFGKAKPFGLARRLQVAEQFSRLAIR
jgi:hypothetical protein